MDIPKRREKTNKKGTILSGAIICGVLSIVFIANEFVVLDREVQTPINENVSDKILNRVKFYGVIKPEVEHSLIAESPGIVKKNIALSGETIRKNEILVELSNYDLRHRLSESEVDYQIQKQGYEKLKVEVGYEKGKLDNRLRVLEQELRLKEMNLAINHSLLEKKIVSVLQYETAENEKFRVALQIELVKEELQAFAKVSEVRLKSMKLEVERTKLQRDLAVERINALTIRSPINGLFYDMNRSLSVGAKIEAGTALGVIVDTNSYFLEAYLPVSLLTKVSVGDEASFYASGSEIKGTVANISKTVSENNIRLSITELNPIAPLLLNMEVSGEIIK